MTVTRADVNRAPDATIVPHIFGRDRERQSLSMRLRQRRSLLVYGPAGVGKTLLVHDIIKDEPQFLYCADSATISGALRSIAVELWRRENTYLLKCCGRAGVAAIATKSAANIKGIVAESLRHGDYCVVLDHLRTPSHSFAAAVREINGWCETPVVVLARSAHMEDVGFLHPLFAERADRFEVKNFDPTVVKKFATSLIVSRGLSASNLDDFLERIFEYSQGNPGAICRMVEMAMQSTYRSGENIKTIPLYIDFRMNWVAGARRV